MPIADLVKIWDRFWFSQSSPLPVAAYRILFGAISFFNFLFLLPDLYVWLGSRGVTSRQEVINWTGVPGLEIFNIFPDNDNFMTFCIVVFMVASIGLCIGFKSRLCSVILFIGFNALYHRDPFILNSGDTYMRVSVFWLIFAATGNALAVDSRKNARTVENPSGSVFDNYKPVSIWPLRLLQLQLAMVYCHTFYRKFPGASWVDGNAVYYSSRVEDLQRFPMPFIFDHLWTIQFFTWSTLALEFALFTLIWIKETRYIVLACGVIFHLTIDYHMNIPFFEYIMIASYVLFVDSKDIARVLRFFRDRLCKKTLASPGGTTEVS